MSSQVTTAVGRRFRTLHARVLAAFVAVILLTLLSAGSAAVWLVQGYRTQIEVDHISDLAVAAAITARQVDRLDPRPEEVAALIASQLGPIRARALVLDGQGKVLAERPEPAPGQEPSFTGRVFELPEPTARPVRTGVTTLRPVARLRAGAGGRQYILIAGVLPQAPEPRPAAGASGSSSSSGPGGSGGSGSGTESSDRLDRFFARPPTYRVVLAVPERNIVSAWRELAPRLVWAALIGVFAALAAASWLSGSITRRLGQITRAAEGIARGELRQEIRVSGVDEVAQLAASFNFMSREVERSHRALREFLADASHELRTPLTSIQGFSQALVDAALPGPEGAVEAGRIINEEAERMRHLVEDLLYLSKVETRDVPATRGEVDVAALVREIARRLQLICAQRRLDLRLDLAEPLSIVGDADELDRLFGNLLENAAKYTPEGGTISVVGVAAPAGIRVEVHNTGSYIPPEDLSHVFDRFYRVDKSRARDVEGSGLGLAIAAQVAERHGGTIRVTSGRATGTSFDVTLPVSGQPSDSMPQTAAPEAPRSDHGRDALPQPA